MNKIQFHSLKEHDMSNFKSKCLHKDFEALYTIWQLPLAHWLLAHLFIKQAWYPG